MGMFSSDNMVKSQLGVVCEVLSASIGDAFSEEGNFGLALEREEWAAENSG